ncbi:16S rRNA processing protein RimM [Geobacter sp. DSM 9736]|nr:16S rRNA processing protein RimM [Geobacter sp. DSM 9736]
MMVDGGKLVLLGKVAATHGIKGQLRIVSYSGELDTILSLNSFILKGTAGETETFTVAAAAVHGKKVLITLKGLADINLVERLVGRELYVRREQLPELDEGEFYWCELEGLKVRTDKGELLGELTSLIPTGSNDVYVVTGGKKEYLIPAVEEIVTDIDLDAGIMTVSPPEGLLDL